MNLFELIINTGIATVFTIVWLFIPGLKELTPAYVIMFHILLFNQITIGAKTSKISE